MCLTNVAHKRFITQARKKSKAALMNVIGPGPGAEKNEYRQASKLKIKVTTWW